MYEQQRDITSRTVRQLLKLWADDEQLGRHPLAELQLVMQRLTHTGGSDTAVGRGLALKGVLGEVIETLRPHPNNPDPTQPEWHPYLIITAYYCCGRTAAELINELQIKPHTFYKLRKQALDKIAAQLRYQERTLRFSS